MVEACIIVGRVIGALTIGTVVEGSADISCKSLEALSDKRCACMSDPIFFVSS